MEVVTCFVNRMSRVGGDDFPSTQGAKFRHLQNFVVHLVVLVLEKQLRLERSEKFL